jgi:hypothetical protein
VTEAAVERPPAHTWRVPWLGKRCGRCGGSVGDSRTAVLSLEGDWCYVPVCRTCMAIIFRSVECVIQ